MNITFQPAPTINQTKVLLGTLFSCQILGLYKLIEHFGGKKLAKRLDNHVLETANRVNLPMVIEEGKVRKMRADQAWNKYSDVMQEAVDFSISVAGTRLVSERVRAVTNGIEERTETSYYEIAFRLGLIRLHG